MNQIVKLRNDLMAYKSFTLDAHSDHPFEERERAFVRAREHKEAIVETFKKQADCIAELEAAQRWIPVSERLPESGVRVLVTIEHTEMREHEWARGVAVAVYDTTWQQWHNEALMPIGDYWTILAWLPLPEPYEATS